MIPPTAYPSVTLKYLPAPNDAQRNVLNSQLFPAPTYIDVTYSHLCLTSYLSKSAAQNCGSQIPLAIPRAWKCFERRRGGCSYDWNVRGAYTCPGNLEHCILYPIQSKNQVVQVAQVVIFCDLVLNQVHIHSTVSSLMKCLKTSITLASYHASKYARLETSPVMLARVFDTLLAMEEGISCSTYGTGKTFDFDLVLYL